MHGVRTHNFSGDKALIAQVIENPTTIRSRPRRTGILKLDQEAKKQYSVYAKIWQILVFKLSISEFLADIITDSHGVLIDMKANR